MERNALKVAAEQERARRLVDRLERDTSEGSELAREKRAREVSAVFRRDSDLDFGGNSAGTLNGSALRKRESVRQLDAALDLRRQSQLCDFFLVDGSSLGERPPPKAAVEDRLPAEPASAREGEDPFLAAEERYTPRRGSTRARRHDGLCQAPRDTLDEPTAFAPPPRGSASGEKTAFEALRDSLEEVTVKNLLEFRTYARGQVFAEALATAAICVIANIDDTVQVNLMSLDPEVPWLESLNILGKPGHFLNSLRRFPYATDAGRVPDQNMVAARHYLGFAIEEGLDDADPHPALLGLRSWIEHAVVYWDNAGIPSAPSSPTNHRSSSSPKAAAAAPRPQLPQLPSQATAGVYDLPPPVQLLPSARSADDDASPMGSPMGSDRRERDGFGSSRGQPTAMRRTGSARGDASPTQGRPSAPHSQRSTQATTTPARRSPPGGAGASRMLASPASGKASPKPASSAAFGSRGPRMSGVGCSAEIAARRAVGAANLESSRQNTARQVRTGKSPGRTGATALRSSPSAPPTRPALSPSPPTIRSAANRPFPAPPAATARSRQQSPVRAGLQSPARAPAARVPGDSSGSRAGGDLLGYSKSAGTLGNRPSARGPGGVSTTTLARPRAMSPGATSGSHSQLAAATTPPPALPPPAAPQTLAVQQSPAAIEEWKRQLEETKKEVREIRSLETRMRWSMQREEKQDVVTTTKEQEMEIMDWRWKQSDEMKEFVDAKEHEQKIEDLEESKDFQEFKREVKLVAKEEEKRLISEEYLEDVDAAAWRMELAQALHEREKDFVAEKFDSLQEVKEIEVNQRLQEKVEKEEDRTIEQNLEMQNIAKQLQKEKEELLASLQYCRSRQGALPLGGKGSSAASARY